MSDSSDECPPEGAAPASAPRKPPPPAPSTQMSGVASWLRTYAGLLLLFAVVVAYQTRLLGYYEEAAVNARLKAAAERTMRLGEIQLTHLKEGPGDAVKQGEWVTTQLSGWEETTGQFWSTSFDRERSFTFFLGDEDMDHRVIPGIEQAVLRMRVGGSAKVVIPPDLAFGERGKAAWQIPPWSAVTFDIHILSSSVERPTFADDPFAEAEILNTYEREAEAVGEVEEKVVEEERGEEQAKAKAVPAVEVPSVSEELLAELQKMSLAQLAATLAEVGLVAVEDLMLLESVTDLPDKIPTFSRKKLVARAEALRKQSTQAQTQTQAEQEQPKSAETTAQKNTEDSANKDTGADEATSAESCTAGSTEGGDDSCAA